MLSTQAPNGNRSRLLSAILMAVATAAVSWLIIGRCPSSLAGIDTLNRVWPLVGYACERQLEWSSLLSLPGSFILIVLQTGGILVVSLSGHSPLQKSIRLALLAIATLCLYFLMFVVI